MSKFARFGISTLAVLFMVSLASGALIGCSSSSDSDPASDPSASDSGGGEDEANREVCTVECLGLGQTEGTQEWKDCMDECMERKK